LTYFAIVTTPFFSCQTGFATQLPFWEADYFFGLLFGSIRNFRRNSNFPLFFFAAFGNVSSQQTLHSLFSS